MESDKETIAKRVITLYTRENCATCFDTKRFLNEREIEYTEVQIGKGIEREELLSKYPKAKLLPVVTLNEHFIGSKEELIRYIVTKEKLDG
jgi:glutaredoxin